ncbi:hypothetical protein [Catenuloplanes indicus]|uniref:Uncharacterized protein n=1 Tax=Catenuloplanes indicus TaxID=137267 RepID=A0AAE4AWP6_9ACTN|nr:hypothetical protein [Catenuloplanes indicus]MDQ0365267.1 hypothetical protein [Catenuloplanes indicus]
MTEPGKNPAEQEADRRPPLQRAIPLRGLTSPDAPEPQSEDSGSWGTPKLPSWPAQPVPAPSDGPVPPAGAAPATFAPPSPATSAGGPTVATSPAAAVSPPAVEVAAASADSGLPTVAASPEAFRDHPSGKRAASHGDAAREPAAFHGDAARGPEAFRGDSARESAETTAGLAVTGTSATAAEAGPAAGARPAPRPRLWLVPLVLIGAIVITAAALAGRGLDPDGADRPVAVPPATFGAPATGQVTIITPSAGPTSAVPSAGATPSSPAPSRTASPTPAPARTTAAAAAQAPPPATRAPVASGPITGYSACTTGSAVVLAVTFTKPFDWHHAYLDVDGNASTGYDVPDIGGRLGADYMVENDGLFRANDTEWDWSEVESSGLQTARTGTTFRWQVPRSALSPTTTLRVVFNGSGNTPDTNTPVLTAGPC